MDNKTLQELVKKVNTMDKNSNSKEKVKEVQGKAREQSQEHNRGREVER